MGLQYDRPWNLFIAIASLSENNDLGFHSFQKNSNLIALGSKFYLDVK